MACPVCGGSVMAGQRFCSACGTRVVPAGSPMAPEPVRGRSFSTGNQAGRATRVGRHVQTLGILWCVYGVLRLGVGLFGIFVLRTMTLRRFGVDGWPLGSSSHPFPPIFPPLWMDWVLPVIAGVTLLATVLALLTGYALLTRRQWGRTLAIVTAVLTLIKLPLGTALGIYTLWVLAPFASGEEYAGMVERDEL